LFVFREPIKNFQGIEICEKIQKDNGKGRRPWNRRWTGGGVYTRDCMSENRHGSGARRPAAQRQAPRARASRTAGTTPPSRTSRQIPFLLLLLPPPSLTPPSPLWTGQTAVCRRLRTAACGGGRRGRAGGQHGRGRVCPGGWGEGRRIRCRGRGAPLAGSRQWAAWRGQMRSVAGRVWPSLEVGGRRAAGVEGGRMLAAGADGCVYVSTGWVCGHRGQRVRWSLLLGHYQSLSCV
jgi:hypothetical protein